MSFKIAITFAATVLIALLSIHKISAQAQNNLELANQYYSTGEYEKAVVYYARHYNYDPFASYPGYLKCLTLLQDFKEAEKLVKKQMKKLPNELALYIDLGKLYAAQNENDKANQQYEKAIRLLTQDVGSAIRLGYAFAEAGLTGKAIETYQTARKLNPTYPFGFELAEMYARDGKLQAMIEEYLNLLMVNEQYYSNVQAIMQNKIVNDASGAVSSELRTELLRRIQKPSSPIVYGDMIYWLFIQEKDFESALIQAKAIDKRLDEGGARILSLGRMCVANEKYETAEKCFRAVIEKGEKNSYYNTARIELVNASTKRLTSQGLPSAEELATLNNEHVIVLNQLGRNLTTASLLFSYAHLKAFYMNQVDSAVSILTELIDMPGISPLFKAQCKLELGDIYIFKGEVWEAALLYGQVDKDFKQEAIGREAKFRNARLSYYMGEFEWAAAQLNVLKAATSQLIANDALSLSLLIIDNTGLDSITGPLMLYSKADLLTFQNNYRQALDTLDLLLNRFANHSLTDEAWFLKARIFIQLNQFDTAAYYFNQVVLWYGNDILADDALYQLGLLYENKLHNKEKAMVAYETLLIKYPGSLLASDARRRFRTLRGDVN
ncbi:MAG: tetratricopeptide repeat protein [Bacteroidia bacterium]|nr:tetratricopeptide repeat protein [Bacteroidia bacterium]MCZ2276486.1 tetratricopeptide repeat protein [Bacteroidia bacterium]